MLLFSVLHFVSREEESKAQNELQRAKLRIAELEDDRRGGIPKSHESKDSYNLKGNFESASSSLPVELPFQLGLSSELSSPSWNVISKLNAHLIQVLHVIS